MLPSAQPWPVAHNGMRAITSHTNPSPTRPQPICAALLDGLSATDTATHAALWDPLLLLLRNHPGAMRLQTPGPSLVLARLVSLLQHGCYGSASVIADALLPLVAQMPDGMLQPDSFSAQLKLSSTAAAAQLLTALWEGLNSDLLQAAQMGAALRAHAELLQLLLVRAGRVSVDAQLALLRQNLSPLVAELIEGLPAKP